MNSNVYCSLYPNKGCKDDYDGKTIRHIEERSKDQNIRD